MNVCRGREEVSGHLLLCGVCTLSPNATGYPGPLKTCQVSTEAAMKFLTELTEKADLMASFPERDF